MKKPDFKNLTGGGITNSDVISLYRSLVGIQDLKGFKLVYAVSRSIAKLKPVIEAMGEEKLIPKSEEYKKYEEELGKLAIKYSKGRTKVVQIAQEQYREIHAFPWDDSAPTDKQLSQREEYTTELEKLRKKYKEVISERENDSKDYSLFLDEEFFENISDYFYKVSSEDVEDFDIPGSMRFVLNYLVKE